MIVVSDTIPLSELAKVGQMDLLQKVYGRVIIPEAVYAEVTTGTHPAVALVRVATWLEVRSVSNAEQISRLQAEFQLDLGECAAIVLAEELNAEQLLLDDLAARIVAQDRGLPIVGTVGTLLLAKRLGLILNVGEIVDGLIAQGKWISPQLYRRILSIAEE